LFAYRVSGAIQFIRRLLVNAHLTWEIYLCIVRFSSLQGGATALHAAAAVGSVEVMQLLIDSGLAVTAVDEVWLGGFVFFFNKWA
jgi:hypothetical protein